MNDLDGSECFDMKLRTRRADPPKHVEVVVKLQPWMQTAYDVHFAGPSRGRLLCSRDNLLDRHLIRPFLAALAVERAELAGKGAYIGVVDVAIAIEVGFAAVQPGAHSVRQPPNRMNVTRMRQGDPIRVRERLARFYPFGDGPE